MAEMKDDISELLEMDKQGILPDEYRKVVDDYKEAVSIAAKMMSDYMDKEIFEKLYGSIESYQK